MMTVVHVFMEDDLEDQRSHLSDWFGADTPSGLPVDAVCACGARMTILDNKCLVSGVYHRKLWSVWEAFL